MNKTPEMERMEADLAASEELRERLDATMKRIADAGEVQSDGELFEKAAAELGYSVTAAELERLSAEMEDLSYDELDQVAGGSNPINVRLKNHKNNQRRLQSDGDGHDAACWFTWHCHAAMLHTTANQKNEVTKCWSNYLCAFSEHNQ